VAPTNGLDLHLLHGLRMAIDVICSGCFKRFQVSDQFAGRSGPCPGCKTIISIPTLDDQVVIEEPDYKPGAAGAHTKIDGIRRRVGVFRRLEITVLCALFGCSAFLGILSRLFRNESAVEFTFTTGALFGVGIVLSSVGSCLLGYGVLKDSEIESFDRRTTFIRSIIAGVIYCLIAAVFVTTALLMDPHDTSRVLILTVVGIACFAIASFVPMVLYEMEIIQGVLHVGIMISIASVFCLLAGNLHLWLLTS